MRRCLSTAFWFEYTVNMVSPCKKICRSPSGIICHAVTADNTISVVPSFVLISLNVFSFPIYILITAHLELSLSSVMVSAHPSVASMFPSVSTGSTVISSNVLAVFL